MEYEGGENENVVFVNSDGAQACDFWINFDTPLRALLPLDDMSLPLPLSTSGQLVPVVHKTLKELFQSKIPSLSHSTPTSGGMPTDPSKPTEHSGSPSSTKIVSQSTVLILCLKPVD